METLLKLKESVCLCSRAAAKLGRGRREWHGRWFLSHKQEGQKVRAWLGLGQRLWCGTAEKPIRKRDIFRLKYKTLLDACCYWIRKLLRIHGTERIEFINIPQSYRTYHSIFHLKLFQKPSTFPITLKVSDGKPLTFTPYFQATKK